ncbi:uncharacterized protein VTP21DRAFT_4696 [Calcarisporiella thermophila]|uniref:uncharacterized protein n=1 Tax=Calcarisporiella thermophila TaxID=911321 RepID=UPI0037425E12
MSMSPPMQQHTEILPLLINSDTERNYGLSSSLTNPVKDRDSMKVMTLATWNTSYPLISKYLSLFPSLLVALIIWNIPAGDGMSDNAMQLLGVFVGIIFALLTTPFEGSVLILAGLVVLSFTRSFVCNLEGKIAQCLTYHDNFTVALGGFSTNVNWMVFASFQLGKAVDKTKLGRRLSLIFIKYMGSNVIGLGYAVFASEFLLAPFVPSNTARGGGIILPIVVSIASTLSTTPNTSHSSSHTTKFLALCGAHANLLSASMVATGMVANPLVVQKAASVYKGVTFGYGEWAIGAFVPSLVIALLLPPLFFAICGESSITDDPGDQMRDLVERELDALGPFSSKEYQLCSVLLLCLVFWMTQPYTNFDGTLIAVCGVVILLLMETITWKDVCENTKAFDAFIWMGGLIALSEQLSSNGVGAFFGHILSRSIHQRFTPLPSALALGIIYFFSTFFFSSLTAHILAFATPFLEAGKKLGSPPMVVIAMIGYFSALGGCMTNFSTGTVAMYYTEGRISRASWFGIGLMVASVHILIYLSVGLGWWRVLGWC